MTTRRFKLWSTVAVLFTVINLLGAGYAAVNGELLHTAVHAGLVLLGLLGAYIVYEIRSEPQY